MNAKAIKSIGLACVALMLASCASHPHYSHRGGNYPNGGGQIDVAKTAALVAVGVAGLSLYHYSREKDKRKKVERAYSNHHRNRYEHRGHDQRRRY